MRTNYPFEINNKNNNSLSDTLPKINLSSSVLKTSPNITLKRTINNYNRIPLINKLNKSPFNETVKKKNKNPKSQI